MNINKDELKAKIQISEAIEKIYPISKRANGAIAVCPFHQDKSPSLSMVDDKGFYYCFSCGQSGDMYDFYMKYLNISFHDAITKIASEFGYTFKVFQKNDSIYYDLNKLALKLYTNNKNEYLKNDFNNFLKIRKFDEKIAEVFNIGITGKSDQLAKYIETFDEEKREKWQRAAVELGLLYKKDNKYFDSFKNRIIFPIINEVNSIVGFASRKYKESDNSAKYKNSPTSLIFNKSSILYGENLVAKDTKTIILVEGYMDVISLHEKGITNAVAMMGLSLSDKKIMELMSKYEQIYLGLDTDEAGINAAKSISLKFLQHQYLPSVIDWSPCKDADEFINNEYNLELALKEAKPIIKIRGLNE